MLKIVCSRTDRCCRRARSLITSIGGGLLAGSAQVDLDQPVDTLVDGRRRPVTMRDVAAAAGVSVSAVSYVMNKTRPVSADKRERVLKAIADLEYVPNGMAQALRRTRSGILGVILPDLSTPPY